ncbi:PseG/SpsG family protein [Micromonospora rifamycinica]|uniref:Spore coat polysaccharide biosynthesis protein SpsG, predicted glycosyltransferase n=1 Tax=Micromonospora rifamycinica TaxID=291594 RepID=A0A109II91_9ACTN|nr:spore coat protein [Micromonospora rifamycinica]KWV31028.1 spore coat protein [Micromonospora rifamycinica]SCG50538.1 Spore coat polysaccharide biosynthesis protein SpsG, predicted glycosyltransferase [Micromonospora rifamycinica]
MKPPRIGLRCDAGPRTGVGHLVRCLALGEEFLARGARVELFGTVERVGWASTQLTARGIPVRPGPDTPAGLVEAARRHALDALVLDSYELDPAGAGALRTAGVVTLAIVDGDTRGQDADLYLDQNFGADTLDPAHRPGGRMLAGVRYALLRDAVTAARPAAPPPASPTQRPRVLAFFGGTDAVGAAPVLARVLFGTGHPLELTVVVGRPEIGAELAQVVPGRGQSLHPVAPTDALPTLIGAADLVVSAAGTSTWELCCLGAPAALVCVVDNQRDSYRRVVAHGLAAGLGELPDLVAPGLAGRTARADAARTLRTLLASPRRRAALAARAWATVDGHGRTRVAEAVLTRIADRTGVLNP